MVAGLVTVGTAAPALAATSPGTTTATANVQASITLSGLTPAFTLTGAPGATATSAAAVTMKVTTNNTLGYTVAVQAAAATMTGATAGNTDTIPVSALTVKENTGATYTALSATAAVTVHSQNGKSVASGDTVTNDMQMAVPFTNSDSYSVALNYIATTK
jgi:large repetitive protein